MPTLANGSSLWTRLAPAQPAREERVGPAARVQVFGRQRSVHRIATLLVAGVIFAPFATASTYQLDKADAAAWAQILTPFGLQPAASAPLVIHQGATAAIRETGKRVAVRNVEQTHRPALETIWEKELDLPVYELPATARVFTRDRWTQAPLVAGWKEANTLHLWTAVSPGEKGYDRFPYLPQSLADLGWDPPYRGNRLWAFFDSGYRARADFDYLAARWRRAGIAGLHVAAWHYFDGDPAKAAELNRLIEACHKQRILVYAWLELPHVSEKFWHDHPAWREKTALLADAHLDWRKLMNLRQRDCFNAVAQGIRAMLAGHDWDGVNLAELYFESLEGVANPARLTPMNADIRQEFRAQHGFDPLEIFTGSKPTQTKLFIDYRADLAARMQREWLDVLQGVRRAKPHLELVWTHIDDRYDTRMRDLLGADTSRVLPLLPKYDATLLVEDPATVWHLGPRRYLDIAEKYGRNPRVAIDINIVERYQDVYPTKQQTGVELFQLAHFAVQGFERVALYFENSILPVDYPLLAAASGPAVKADGLRVSAAQPFGLRFAGDPLVNGKPWPVRSQGTVWLPAGTFTVTAAPISVKLPVLDLNATLLKASASESGTDLEYRSAARALMLVPVPPGAVTLDGKPIAPRTWKSADGIVLELPPGEHKVKLTPPSGDRIT